MIKQTHYFIYEQSIKPPTNHFDATLASYAMAACDEDRKPSAVPKNNAGSSRGHAPAASPRNLPDSSTGVASVAQMPQTTPATPPSTSGDVPTQLPQLFDAQVPYAIDAAGGDRYTLASWIQDYMTGENNFIDRIAEAGLHEGLLQLVEASADGGTYEMFAADYVARESNKRHVKMERNFKEALAAERKLHLERYEGRSDLSPSVIESTWKILSDELTKNWSEVVAKAEQQFKAESNTAYKSLIAGAACTCCLKGKPKNEEEDDDKNTKKRKATESRKKKEDGEEKTQKPNRKKRKKAPIEWED